jgi:hypothetical protein
VFSQLFRCEQAELPVALNEPIVSTVEEAVNRVPNVEGVVFATQDIEALAASNLVVRPPSRSLAEEISNVACMRFGSGDRPSADTVRACYVRPAEAEVKLKLGLLGSKIKRSLRPEQRHGQ